MDLELVNKALDAMKNSPLPFYRESSIWVHGRDHNSDTEALRKIVACIDALSNESDAWFLHMMRNGENLVFLRRHGLEQLAHAWEGNEAARSSILSADEIQKRNRQGSFASVQQLAVEDIRKRLEAYLSFRKGEFCIKSNDASIRENGLTSARRGFYMVWPPDRGESDIPVWARVPFGTFDAYVYGPAPGPAKFMKNAVFEEYIEFRDTIIVLNAFNPQPQPHVVTFATLDNARCHWVAAFPATDSNDRGGKTIFYFVVPAELMQYVSTASQNSKVWEALLRTGFPGPFIDHFSKYLFSDLRVVLGRQTSSTAPRL